MKSDKVLVPLAPGFEEIEAVTIIDVLRRANVEVLVAGLEAGPIRGAHGIEVVPDTTLDLVSPDELAMVALPGGLPGAEHLRDHPKIQEILKALARNGRYVAAICAAPIALSAAGLTRGRSVTSYPGFGDGLECRQYLEDRVVVDDKIITSRGPGTALEFALALVEKLRGPDEARNLARAMLVDAAAPPREATTSA